MNGQNGAALAAAARQLIGCPFRLHGRDPHTGLDCIGLFTAAMAASGRKVDVPPCYGLRNTTLHQAAPLARQAGLQETAGPVAAGDVLLVRLSALQAHLMIAASPDLFIHAHAGLRRVVTSPAPADGLLPSSVLHHWRLADSA